jgi:hypothetical protein
LNTLSAKKLPLSKLENRARRLSAIEAKQLLIYNRELLQQGKKLFNILPMNWRPPKKEFVMLIFLLRALENLRSVEILTRNGYIAQAASLAANSIEIYLQTRKVKADISAAEQWLNHDSTKPCWPITGENGLCRKLNKAGLEGHYRLLCTIKHTQSKTMHLNFVSYSGQNSLIMAPLWQKELAEQVLIYNTSVVFDVLEDCADQLKKLIDSKLYKRWVAKFELLRDNLNAHIDKLIKQWKAK